MTLIGRRLQDDEAVERLQNAGIALGQGKVIADEPVPARGLHVRAVPEQHKLERA